MSEISVDFRGVTPAQGGGFTDKVPRGLYQLRIAKVEPRVTANGGNSVRLSLEVASGPYENSRLQDEFFLDASAKGSRFGAQRFMACLIAFGVAVKQDALRFEGDRLIGKMAIVEVRDDKMPASKELNADNTPKYPERDISRPDAYYNRQALPVDIATRLGIAPQTTQATNGAAAPAAIAEANVAQPVPAAPVPSPAIVTMPTEMPASVTAPDPVPDQVAQVSQSVDDLFT